LLTGTVRNVGYSFVFSNWWRPVAPRWTVSSRVRSAPKTSLPVRSGGAVRVIYRDPALARGTELQIYRVEGAKWKVFAGFSHTGRKITVPDTITAYDADGQIVATCPSSPAPFRCSQWGPATRQGRSAHSRSP
jgi:hypothetical protein